MKCEYCMRDHNGSYASGRFCSEYCARGFSSRDKRKEINEKVSKKMTFIPIIKVICGFCNKTFERKENRKSKIMFCSRKCQGRYIGSLGGRKSAYTQPRRSKNEICFSKLCDEVFDNILTNEPIFDGWDADVIIPSIKYAVLWNGVWHYKQITKKHSLLQVQNRDKLKINKILACGYTPYVIKDMGPSNEEFVKEQFELFMDEVCVG